MQKYKQLDLKDRYTIKAMLDAGRSQTKIAEIISVHKSTISRELSRNVPNCGRYANEYCSEAAQRKTDKGHAEKAQTLSVYRGLKGGCHPGTGGDSWDTTPGVAAVIAGGNEHETFKRWLDKFAEFVLDLRGANRELIPVIFRPYHEHTDSRFWWDDEQTTVEEYVTLWRFTVDYLTQEKNVHNLLYAYSPDGSPSRFQKYMEK